MPLTQELLLHLLYLLSGSLQQKPLVKGHFSNMLSVDDVLDLTCSPEKKECSASPQARLAPGL